MIEDNLKNVIDLNKVKMGQFPILLRIYGKRYVRAISVEPTWKNLHVDGVFVLDKGTHIYQWHVFFLFLGLVFRGLSTC